MLTKIPPWVPVILLLLVVLGWRQSRTRRVAPATAASIATAMVGLSLYGVIAAFGAHLLPLAAWALALAGAATLGRPVFGPRGLSHATSDGAVLVPGSWLPLGLMLGIFGAKFALGFAAGVGSPLLHEPAFGALMAALLGLLSGAFAARALCVLRFARDGRRAAVLAAASGAGYAAQS